MPLPLYYISAEEYSKKNASGFDAQPEARFGFPQEMEDKTISYLLDNMNDVLKIIACA